MSANDKSIRMFIHEMVIVEKMLWNSFIDEHRFKWKGCGFRVVVLVVMSFRDVDESEGVVLVVGCFLECGVVLNE
jgi:hypothetical protein